MDDVDLQVIINDFLESGKTMNIYVDGLCTGVLILEIINNIEYDIIYEFNIYPKTLEVIRIENGKQVKKMHINKDKISMITIEGEF